MPITKENTYQIVFVSLMYFSFSNLPIRRFDRQEKPFLLDYLEGYKYKNCTLAKNGETAITRHTTSLLVKSNKFITVTLGNGEHTKERKERKS